MNLSSQMLAVVAMSLGFSLTSHGAEPIGQVPTMPLSPDATHALLSIDGVPNPTQLEPLIPGQTLTSLLGIASSLEPINNSPKDDQAIRDWIPIRLRAIRAASMFELADGDPQISLRRTTLKALLNANRSQASGSGVLLAQAALESLGKVGGAEDPDLVMAVSDSLTHPSRDIRIAAARALRQMGAATALEALRRRQSSEEFLGVRLAISEAIQALNQNPAPAPSTTF